MHLYFLAVLITGSGSGTGENTAELFVPTSGTSCTLPPLPQGRGSHTVDNNILCGGSYSNSDSCLQWNQDTGTWEELLTLELERDSHVSWTPGTGIGTYLIGGWGINSGFTTTLVTPGGVHVPGFPLKYDTR